MRPWIVLLCLLGLPLTAFAQTIDTPPKLVTEIPVEYPPRALEERVESAVLMTIDIDVTGHVTKVEVTDPGTPADYGFGEAAKKAVEQFVFEPAMSAGQPVAVRIQYRYRFTPPPLPEPSPPPVAEPSAAPATTPVQQGPTGELGGTILERGKRSPLVGATVIVQRGSEAYEAVTDAAGNFSFYDLAVGSWSMSIQSSGYLAAKTEEQVAAHERTDVKLYLERTADNPYDVTVEAAAPKREVTRRRIDVKEAQSLPGTFGDPILAVENLPGIAVPPFDPTGISMRGAAPDESATYIEGFRIPLLYHFVGFRSVMAPGMLDSFDLYPGGAPSYYGRQTGGVLDARLKRLSPDRLHGYVDISLLDAGAYVETPLGSKVSIAVAGRASYIDRVMAKTGTPFPRYDDYQVSMVARPRAAHTLKLFYLGSDDGFKIDAADLDDAQITNGNAEAAAHMQHVAFEHEFAPSKTVQNKMRIGFLHWNTLFHLGDDSRVDATYDTLLARDTLRLTPAKWIGVEVGVDAELGRWTTDVLIAGGPPKEGDPQGGYVDFERDQRKFTRNIPQVAAGGWVNLELRPFEKLLIVPGVRSDLQPQIEKVTVDPRVMARYEVIPQLALKAGTSVNHGVPTLDESAKRFGNPNLGAERSIQNSAGVEITALEYLHLDLTGFYNKLDGLAAPTDKLVEMGGKAVALNYQSTGEGHAYGFEGMLRHDLSHRLSGWVAYTYAHSERRNTSKDPYRLLDQDQTHTLVIVGQYHLPRHWKVSSRFRYRTGQPTTPIVGATYVSDDDVYAPKFGGLNSRRFDAFQQLDLRIDKQWVFNAWSITGYLDVQNVYNHKNGVATAYNYDYSKPGKVTSLPILPVVGLKAEY
jgi:TonB family protein